MSALSRVRTAALLAAALMIPAQLGCATPDEGTADEDAVVNAAKVCPPECNDGNPCTTDSCDAKGRCHNDPVPAGTNCCVGSTPITCTASDQCHDPGTCDPSNGICSNPAKSDGASCNDGNLCTQTDTCQAGTCVGGNPVVCNASDQCHDPGACDLTTGTCTNPAKSNGSPCDDGDACTQTDTCEGGVCTGDNPVVCTASDQCHVAGMCDSSTGICTNPAASNGTACNDGNLCTQTDTCQAGACVGANPVVCTASDQCHVVGTCDPSSGMCSNPAAADGTPCEDGDSCTAGDTCSAGACASGGPLDCDDGDACTLDNCDPSSGCLHSAVTCAGPASACSGACTDTANGCSTYICPGPPLGCSAGYWKQPQHFDNWADYYPQTLLADVFSVPSSYNIDPLDTCLDALDYQGNKSKRGAAEILLRQAVAALLNASYDPSWHFPIDAWDLEIEVNAALASQDRATMLALAQELDEYNSASGGGCPLN